MMVTLGRLLLAGGTAVVVSGEVTIGGGRLVLGGKGLSSLSAGWTMP